MNYACNHPLEKLNNARVCAKQHALFIMFGSGKC